jgi:hypothetical protein
MTSKTKKKELGGKTIRKLIEFIGREKGGVAEE